MAWWPVAVACLALATVLAGCSGGGDSGGDGTGASSTSTSSGPSLVARFEARAGNETAGNGTLAVDVNQTVSFDASNSTGAIATYLWDFGDGGNATGRTAEHSYLEAGAYTVRLTVSGLLNSSANATLTVNVTAPPTGYLFSESFAIGGELPAMNPNSCTNQGIDCNDHVVTLVGADPNGTAAIATSVNITVDSSGGGVAVYAYWRSPDGTVLAQDAANSADKSISFQGPMPAGDYVLRVRLFVGAGVTYTAAVTVDYSYA